MVYILKHNTYRPTSAHIFILFILHFLQLYSFYSKTASKDEKFEIATKAVELLKNASDIVLDNKLMYALLDTFFSI